MIDTTAVWTTALNNLPGLLVSLGTLITSLVAAYLLLKGQQKSADTAAQTKTDLVREQKVYNTKLDTIHAVVNSAHGTSLRLSSTLAQRVADLTQDPGDIAVAKASLAAADAHDAQQVEADKSLED